MRLVISSLSKTYPNGVKALSSVSLTIAEGMFGLLGPNGAGKSSLMRTLATLQKPDCGTVFLDNLDVLKDKTEVRQILGYLPQDFGVYPKITAHQMLDHIARLKGVKKKLERDDLVNYMLDKVNLLNHKRKNLGTFSGGMKQRFGIAQALLGNPKLIIVDEPTAGLDPTERNRFYNLLSKIGEDAIVILSTHYVEDVSTLCSNFAIICNGKVLYEGTPAKARGDLDGEIYSKLIDSKAIGQYETDFKVISTSLDGGNEFIRVHSENDPGNGFESVKPNLEDVYFCRIRNESNLRF